MADRRPLREALASSGGLAVPAWFDRIASLLLDRSALVVAGRAHRLREVELYLHGPGHEDPFAHRDPRQVSSRRWYLHRQGGSYRAGTYKGIDLTFGPPSARGGILLRSLSTPEGRLVSGSSLCVDHLLARTGLGTVAALDRALGEMDDPTRPVHLAPRPPSELAAIVSPGSPGAPRSPFAGPAPLRVRSARVGLTLKRAAQWPTMPAFLLRPYRYLDALRTIRKGRPQVVLALLRGGAAVEEVVERLGTPRRTVEAYLAAYRAGRALRSSRPFWGRALTSLDLCRLSGWWDAASAGPGAVTSRPRGPGPGPESP